MILVSKHLQALLLREDQSFINSAYMLQLQLANRF